MRLAIAVSEDVDPYSMDDVMWCLTTRVNPQDRHPQPDPRRPRPDLHAGRAHDRGRPAMDRVEHRFEGGMGIDATVPFGYESDFLRPVYPVDKVKPEDFFSKKDLKTPSRGWSAGSTRWRRSGAVALRPNPFA
jgi:4-hydroxy-3-polyprenylbenzoate decarboxylase